VIDQGGIDTERSYPYLAKDSGTERPICNYHKVATGAKISLFEDIANEDDLLAVVGAIGPASVCFQVAADFRLYSSGIYSSTTCSPKTADVNHAVLIVGFDTDKDGNKYWIVKNSWSSKWGNEGYFWIQRGANMCGIADCASYPVVKAASS